MSGPHAPPNRLLHGLPRQESSLLEAHFEPMALVAGDLLCHADAPLAQVVFPHAGVISLVADVAEDQMLELSLMGNEGMLGLPLVLEGRVSSMGALVQADGDASRLEASRFASLLDALPVLRARAQRYAHDLLRQISQTAVCNTFHDAEQRTARWVLEMANRTHSSEVRVTQAFIAGMLGVRRPAISIAASALLAEGLLEYTRGVVRILDRPGLERAACACYAIVQPLSGAAPA